MISHISMSHKPNLNVFESNTMQHGRNEILKKIPHNKSTPKNYRVMKLNVVRWLRPMSEK